MKTIPETFSKNGYDYRLLERTPKHAIYEQCRGAKVYAYELVTIRTREASEVTRGGVTFQIEAGEYLPKTDEWGSQGWTFSTLERCRYQLANKEAAGALVGTKECVPVGD